MRPARRFVIAALLAMPASAAAQVIPEQSAPAPTGTLRGRILDKASGEGLPAATLAIKGAPEGDHTVVTDLDGTFTIALPPGHYTAEISTPDYIPLTRTFDVAAGATIALDASLELIPAKATEETIEVYDAIDTRKSSAVLAERRAAATVSDAISAEQISRSPDSNASDAAKRMVAATIEDNRYIVIRGLGGRYSMTLLNGVPLPSPDPDVPAAPLDLFPASLITNLTVHKTFSPDLPAGFAGGSLDIETRTYPTRFSFTAKLASAESSLASFRTLNGQDGGGLDVLGFDDGGRSLPSTIPPNKLAGDPSLSQAQYQAQMAAFKSNWEVRRHTVGPNLGVAATIGDTVKVADQRVGYSGSVSYGHAYGHRRAHIERVGGEDGMGGRLPSVLQLDDDTGVESANLGAIASAGWTPKSGHKLDLFREIAPALYYDYVRRRAVGGNPNLVETTIHNGDLRWETFLGEDEVLAASVFAKHFAQPIERTVEDAGDGQNIGFTNTPSANTYGVELEARVSLGRLARPLAEFSAGANLSVIRSRIDVGGASRALQGQSPYVANLGLGYQSRATGTRVDLLFNSFGRRIEEVGTGGAGNVYEEPFHRLDLAISQPLPHAVRLKLSGTNLLDQRVVRTQDGVEIFAYDVGVTVVGSVEMTVE